MNNKKKVVLFILSECTTLEAVSLFFIYVLSVIILFENFIHENSTITDNHSLFETAKNLEITYNFFLSEILISVVY